MLLEPIDMYNEIRRQEQKEDLIGQSWAPQIEDTLQRRPFYSREVQQALSNPNNCNETATKLQPVFYVISSTCNKSQSMECNGSMYNHDKNKIDGLGRNQVRTGGSRLMYSIKRSNSSSHVILGSIRTNRCQKNLVTGGE
jgi:hypothetical protein